MLVDIGWIGATFRGTCGGRCNFLGRYGVVHLEFITNELNYNA